LIRKMIVWVIKPWSNQGSINLFGRKYMLPSTPAVVAGAVRSQDILEVDVRIVDENVEEISFKELPDVVFISCMTYEAARAYVLAQKFAIRGVKVVLGGVHPTVMPEEASSYGAVVIGEIEPTLPQLMADLAKGKLKDVYERVGRTDLDELPRPAYDLLQRNKYNNTHSLEHIHGCAFDCDFCTANIVFGDRVHRRSPELLAQEFRELPSRFAFLSANDIMAAGPGYAKDVCRALVPLNKKWFAQSSVGVVHDQELMELLPKSGCVALLMGFETLTGDGTDLKKAKNHGFSSLYDYYGYVIEKLHSRGIATVACFISGLDDQKDDIFELVDRFIRETNADIPQLTVATAYPGSKLRANIEAEGRLISGMENRWECYDIVRPTHYPKGMTLDALLEGYQWLGDRVYSKKAILQRISRSRKYLPSLYNSIGVLGAVNPVYKKLYEQSKSIPSVNPPVGFYNQRDSFGLIISKAMRTTRRFLYPS